jgi:hypothetical protein
VRRVEEIVDEFAESDSELLPEALAKAAVVLRAAEEIAQQVAKSRAATGELNHAGGDCAAKERAAKNAANQVRGDLEISDEFGAEARGIASGLAFNQSLREQIAGAKRVEKAFAGDGVNARGGVARERPVGASNFSVAQRAELGRRQNVAVEARAGDGNFFFVNETVEESAQGLRGVFGHFGADADGKMISSRERPHVTGHAVQEFDFDEVFLRRNEVAKRNFEILRAKRSGSGEKLIASASGENDKVGGMVFTCGGELDLIGGSFDAGDARVMDLASGGFGTVEQQAVEHSARVNHQRPRHFEACAMAATGDEFGAVNLFFGRGAVEQERVFFDGFVSEATAAGFFPGEVLVKKGDTESSGAEFFGAESPSGPSAHNGNLFHSREDHLQTGTQRLCELKV